LAVSDRADVVWIVDDKAPSVGPDHDDLFVAALDLGAVSILPQTGPHCRGRRAKHPRDRAKGGAAPRIVERWLLQRLHRRRFHGLVEVNAAIAELVVRPDDQRVLRHACRTRHQLFEETDATSFRPRRTAPS
jgi:hypothetical protein